LARRRGFVIAEIRRIGMDPKKLTLEQFRGIAEQNSTTKKRTLTQTIKYALCEQRPKKRLNNAALINPNGLCEADFRNVYAQWKARWHWKTSSVRQHIFLKVCHQICSIKTKLKRHVILYKY